MIVNNPIKVFHLYEIIAYYAVFTLERRLPPCVIFIDEVDSLLSNRDGKSDDSEHGTLSSVKTTMMSE